jgi:PAS domain S-box-containing protein
MSTAVGQDRDEIASGIDVGVSVLLDSIAVGVFIVDATGNLVVINEAGLRMVGVSSIEEVRGLHHLRHFAAFRQEDGTPLPPGFSPLQRALTGENVDALEVRNEEDGDHIALRCQVNPLRTPDGRIVGAVKVAVDVTREYDLARVKDDFIRTAAHELKTPLAIISANADAALDAVRRDPVSATRALEGLRRGVDRADRLISSLLDLVDVQGGFFCLSRASVHLDELVLHVISRLPPGAMSRVRLVSMTAADILGDEQRLKRVVQAVVDNALKYSPKTTTVEIAVQLAGDSAEISIRDHGLGIPLDKRSRIFEKYFRAHVGMPDDAGGLGVGLFVAREIIVQHGGRIWFEDADGNGTRFFIQLPLDRKPT